MSAAPMRKELEAPLPATAIAVAAPETAAAWSHASTTVAAAPPLEPLLLVSSDGGRAPRTTSGSRTAARFTGTGTRRAKRVGRSDFMGPSTHRAQLPQYSKALGLGYVAKIRAEAPVLPGSAGGGRRWRWRTVHRHVVGQQRREIERTDAHAQPCAQATTANTSVVTARPVVARIGTSATDPQTNGRTGRGGRDSVQNISDSATTTSKRKYSRGSTCDADCREITKSGLWWNL